MEVSAPSSSDYTQVFHQHYDQVRQIQRELHSALQSHAKGRARRGQAHHPLEASVIDSPSEDSDPLAGIQLSKKELEVFNRLLNDEVLLLRFLKKYKFSLPATRHAVLQHIRFRLQNQLDTLTLPNFLSTYKCPETMFRFLPQTDSLGRPVGLLSLKDAAGMSQDELLRFFAVVFEVGRRWLKEINEARWINEVDCGDDEEFGTASGTETTNYHQINASVPVTSVTVVTAMTTDNDDENLLPPTSPTPAPPSVIPATPTTTTTTSEMDDGDWRLLAAANGKPPLPRPLPEASDSLATVVDDHLDTDFLTPPRSSMRQRSNSLSSSALSIAIPTPRRNLSDDDVLKRTVVAQMSLVVDLDGVGVSNFNTGLPQPLSTLMNSQFPSMLGNSYVLNFRWIHQGLWAVVKNVLPAGATGKIFFATNADELAGLLGVPKEVITEAPPISKCRVFRRLLRPSIQMPRSTWETYVGDLSGSLDEGYHERSASDTDSASVHGEHEEEEDDPFFDARSEFSDISTRSYPVRHPHSLSRSVSSISAASAAAIAAHAALPSHLANSRVVQFIRQILSLPLRAFDNVLVALAKQTFTSIARRVAAAVVCFVAVLLVGASNGRGEWIQRLLMSSIVGPVLGLSPASVSGARRFLPWDLALNL